MADPVKKMFGQGANAPVEPTPAGMAPLSFQVIGNNIPGAGAGKPDGNRLPVAEQLAQSVNKAEEKTAIRGADGSGAPQASAIEGIHDKSINFSKSNYLVNKDVVAAETRFRKRLTLAGLLVLVIAGVVSFFLVPEFHDYVKETSVLIYDLTRSKIPGLEKKVSNRPETKVERSVAPASKDCVRVIANGISTQRSRPLENSERIEMADCYLLSDNLFNAEIFLKPIRSEIEKMSDADFMKAPIEKQYGAALQLLVMSAVRRGAFADVDHLLRNRCRSWRRSSSCAAKIYSSSLRFYPTSAFEGSKKIFAVGYSKKKNWRV